MTATTTTPPTTLPRSYLAWLGGVTVSRLGDAVVGFGLGWVAAGRGGTTAALLLTLGALPRVVLLVVGGVVADRIGARRLLIAGEALLAGLTVMLALAVMSFGTPTWLLLAASVTLGTVTAFCLPASGSMPRRLVPDEQLARALALRQGASQVVLMSSAPLGGALVGVVGLAGVAGGAAVALAIGLGVLVAVREVPGPPESPVGPTPSSRAWWRDVVDAFRVVRRTPGLGRTLALVAIGAALLLPVPTLLVPLLGRASGWGAGPTGAVAGAVGAGVIGAALVAARGGAAKGGSEPRPRTATAGRSVVGPLAVSAAGALVLACGPLLDSGVVPGVVGGLVVGWGSGTFAARIAPLVLGSTPRTHLARVQGVVGLVQLVPVLVAFPVLGFLAERGSPSVALAVTASGMAGSAAWAARGRRTA